MTLASSLPAKSDAQPIRVAALDCGTNTFRLYVADVYPDGSQHQLCRETQIVRLGQGVDETGEIAPESLARALAAAAKYGEILRELQPARVRMVATSASRDARNSGDFVAGIEAAIGVTPEVIRGEEEAELAFSGATRGLAGKFPGPYLVVDLGGGSTELVLGEPGGFRQSRTVRLGRAPFAAGPASPASKPPVDEGRLAAYSMDVGSVRLTERRLLTDPPTASEIQLAHDDVAAMLAKASAIVPLEKTRTIVGVAGTVTSLTAYYLGLHAYDPKAVDCTALTVAEVQRVCGEMLAMTKAERLALGFMQPGRADIIGAGALIWSDVVTEIARQVAAAGGQVAAVVTRESDMLEGIAAKLAQNDVW